MFNRKSATPPMDTLIGEHTKFIGNIESEGSVKILGKLEGDLHCSGDVYVESGAKINGHIFSLNTYIAGSVTGDVTAKNILHLQSTARLYGNIEVAGIVTDEGAILQGNCKMVESSASASAKSKLEGKSTAPHTPVDVNENKPTMKKVKDH